MVLKLGGVLEERMLNLGQDLLTHQSGLGVNHSGRSVMVSRKNRINTALNLIGLITETKGEAGYYRWLAKGLLIYSTEFGNGDTQRGSYESAKKLLLATGKKGVIEDEDETLIRNIDLCLSTGRYTLDSSVILLHRERTLKEDKLADKVGSIADSIDDAVSQMPPVSYRKNKMKEIFVALRSLHRHLVLDLRNIAIEERGNQQDYVNLERSLWTFVAESTAEEAKMYVRQAKYYFEQEYRSLNDMEKAVKILVDSGDGNRNLEKLRLAHYYVGSFLESYGQSTRLNLQWAGIISLRLARVTEEKSHFKEAYRYLKESYQGENDTTLRWLSEATSILARLTDDSALREEANGYEVLLAEKDKMDEISLNHKVDSTELDYASMIPSNVWGRNREEMRDL